MRKLVSAAVLVTLVLVAGESFAVCPSAQAVLQAPQNGARDLTSPVKFSWQRVNGATGYRVLAAIGSAAPVSLGLTTATTLTADVPAGSGYWLVQTLFGEGCPGTLSTRFTLTVSAGATCEGTAPTLVSPANNATNVGSPVTFRWNPVKSAVKYGLFVSTGGEDFSFYGGTESTELEAFVPDGQIRWFVAALFAGCPETRSAVSTFTAGRQDSCPRGAITLRSPAANATVTSPVTLSWSALSGVEAYRVTITDGDASITRRTTKTDETFELPAGTLRWYVEGLRGDCPAIVSAESSFTVQKAANCDSNQPAVLVSPAGSESSPTVVTSPVTLSWNATPNAIGYRLWLSRDGNPFEDVGFANLTQIQLPLPAGTYGWYVDSFFRACDPVPSKKGFFVIHRTTARCPDAAPTPLFPTQGATATAPITFHWTAIERATLYRIFATIDGSEERVIGSTDETELTRVLPPGAATWRVEAVFPDCPSTSSARIAFTIPRATSCTDEDPQLVSPPNGASLTDQEVDFSWTPVSGALRYFVIAQLRNGSIVPIGETAGTTLTRRMPFGDIEWKVIAQVPGCEPAVSGAFRFSIAADPRCPTRSPLLLQPAGTRPAFSPVVFAWSRVAGATGYQVWVAQGEEDASIVAATTESSASAALPPGRYRWFVEAKFPAGCPSTESATGELVVAAPPACSTPERPDAHVVGQALSGTPYRLRWTALPNVALYEVQESTTPDFANAQTFVSEQPVLRFVHEVSSSPVQYLYRVRGVSRCNETRGAYSASVGVFVVPQRTSNASAELGVEGTVVQQIVLPASTPAQAFTTKTDKPWLTVTPATGTVGATPVTLTVTADPSVLLLGTNTGTVTVSYAPVSNGTLVAHAGTTSNVPVSVSLVTPVTPGGKGTPPPDALVFPIVGHATGVNDSLFESDIRVANLTPQTMKYQVTFTPSGADGTVTGTSTTIEIPPNATTALDDIVSSVFGTGTAGSALGMLEVRPLTTPSSTSLFTSVASTFPALNTAAASRTYNFTPTGTFGQFIPAIPFAKFAGKGAVLSLLQVSQSAAYRANFGFAEGSGSPADLLVRVYDTRSNLLATIPVSVGASQHVQVNGMLAANGISDLQDGRVEVEVVNGNGKVTAYVSEIDNKTNDPLLVSAVQKGSVSANRYVVPGMAYINSGFAFWVSDLRVFNAGPSTTATLTFYPQSGGGSTSKDVTIDAGEIEVLDNVVANFFGQLNGSGGSITITTPANTQLFATARTYNQTSNGTYGQFIPAVTVAESVGAADRALQLLQLEASSRIRTNIGIAETTGNPATVELTVTQPDSLVSPVITMDLAANQFTQLPLAGFFEPGAAVYNARVSVKVIGGTGRVTAYGSAVDQITQDPTYVPAQ